MRAAQREVDDGAAAGGVHTTGRFGGDQALQVNLVDNKRFNDLRLDNRRGHLYHRFVFKKDPPFRNRPYAAGEPKLGEIVQKVI